MHLVQRIQRALYVVLHADVHLTSFRLHPKKGGPAMF